MDNWIHTTQLVYSLNINIERCISVFVNYINKYKTILSFWYLRTKTARCCVALDSIAYFFRFIHIYTTPQIISKVISKSTETTLYIEPFVFDVNRTINKTWLYFYRNVLLCQLREHEIHVLCNDGMYFDGTKGLLVT